MGLAAKAAAIAEKKAADKAVVDAEEATTKAKARADAAAKNAAALKVDASSAAVDAKTKADAAHASYEAAQAAEHKANEEIRREKAFAARQEASTIKERLHAAKCKNNPGCPQSDGYCCPTLNGIHLNGIRLACCSQAVEVELSEVDTQATDVAAWFLSIALAAAVSSMVTMKLRGRSDQGASYQNMAA